MEKWREQVGAAFPSKPEFTKGAAESFSFAIEGVHLYGGASIPFQQVGVTVIVGANNAGKSTILREVWETLSQHPTSPGASKIAVERLDLDLGGNPDDAIAWVAENSNFVQRDGQVGFQRALTGIASPLQLAVDLRQKPEDRLGALAHFLTFYGDAQGRFQVGAAAEMRERVDDPPVHPIHRLQDSRPLLDELSEISIEIFGKPLTLDTLGRTLRLRVGKVDMEAPKVDDVPAEYRQSLAELRPLDEQGDGMRSLFGQLLPIVTGSYQLVLIDEPEAFLHPPQVRALGAELGRIAEREELQILAATHDRELLTGLLESGVNVSVVRLTRQDGPPQATRLDAEELRELWGDPILRYTNVLDGLFHRIVVVAEGEGDCAFLEAALDCPGRDQGPVPRNEVLFVATGGKAGMPKVCQALSSLAVPVVAAPDLDVLSDKSSLKSLVESLGGEWDKEFDSLWKKATADLFSRNDGVTNGQVLAEISEILGAHQADMYTHEVKRRIDAQLRTRGSPWRGVKDHGLSAFKGEAREAAAALLDKLRSVGIVPVQSGELEQLAPEVAVRKGPEWLRAALERSAQCNDTTQAHVDRILDAAAQKLQAQSVKQGTTR